MRCALFILLSLGMPAVWAQTAGIPAQSWELISACSAHADTKLTGMSEMEQACPGLSAALAESGYAAFLSERQQAQLDAHSLVELRHIAQRYDESEIHAGRLQAGTLDAILESMQRERADRAPTWWDRIEQWLRELFDNQREQDLSWLAEWFEKLSLSESVMRVTLYVLVGLVIALAIAVVFIELRAAGLMRRRGRRQTVPDMNGEGATERATIDWDRLSPREHLAAILQVLVSTLAASGRLSLERGLTHRELSRYASFGDGAQRASFERIALTAERVVYGRGDLGPEQLEPVIQEARWLQARLAEDLG